MSRSDDNAMGCLSVAVVLFYIVAWVVIIAVAYHFIAKYW